MAQSYPTILLCAFAVQRHRRNAFSENAPGKQIQPEPHRRSFIPQQPLGARPSGGLFIPLVALGKTVSKGDTLGLVVPPIGGGVTTGGGVTPVPGPVIGGVVPGPPGIGWPGTIGGFVPGPPGIGWPVVGGLLVPGPPGCGPMGGFVVPSPGSCGPSSTTVAGLSETKA